ncbi:MAG: hypothetical protein WCI75_10200 [candidate division NC10 bacterium]
MAEDRILHPRGFFRRGLRPILGLLGGLFGGPSRGRRRRLGRPRLGGAAAAGLFGLLSLVLAEQAFDVEPGRFRLALNRRAFHLRNRSEGGALALVLGGAYHGYQQLRNRKVNAALVQGIETARAVLETTPQGQAADAQVVKWLMENQKAAGVFATISTLVDRVSDNPAARIAAQEIAERVQLGAQARPVAATAPTAPAPALGGVGGNCVATLPLAPTT